MRLIGRQQLDGLTGSKDEHVRRWVAGWSAEVAAATWQGPADVLNQFPKARHTGADAFRFLIDSRSRAIDLRVGFQNQVAIVTALTELTQDM